MPVSQLRYLPIRLLQQVNLGYDGVMCGKLTISDQRSRLGDDIIEALECLKSWAREQVIWGWDGSWTGGEDVGGSGATCIGYGAVGLPRTRDFEVSFHCLVSPFGPISNTWRPVGHYTPARSSLRKPGLFWPKFQKPDLLRPVPAEGEAALAAPLREATQFSHDNRSGLHEVLYLPTET